MNSNSQERYAKKKQPVNIHVMAMINFFALVPLVYFIPGIVEPFLPTIKWLKVVIEVGIIVPIISYGIVPIAGSILSRWEKDDVENNCSF